MINIIYKNKERDNNIKLDINDVCILNTPTKTGKSTFLQNLYKYINMDTRISYDLIEFIDGILKDENKMFKKDNLREGTILDLKNLKKDIIKNLDILSNLEDFIFRLKNILGINIKYSYFYKSILNNADIKIKGKVNNCYIFSKKEIYNRNGKTGNFYKDKLYTDTIRIYYNIVYEILKLKEIFNFYKDNNIGIFGKSEKDDVILEKVIIFNNYECKVEDATYEEIVLAFLYDLAKSNKLEYTVICIDDFSSISDYTLNLLKLYNKIFGCYFIISK